MDALFHIIILVSMVAMQQPGSIEQDADPTLLMKEARVLAENGQHEEALVKLLWCFDNGAKENPAFTGVRVSFLLSRIEKLGEDYPPALAALRQRRDAAMLRAEKTKGTSRYMFYMMDVAALNHSLGKDAKNLTLYDELKRDMPNSPILGFLHHFVADELVEAGREDEASALKDEITMATRMPAVIERAWPAENMARLSGNSSVRSTTAYSFDAAIFDLDIAEAQDEADRLSALKRRWHEIILAATYTDVVTNKSFHRSVYFWRVGWLTSGTWTVKASEDLLTSHDSLSKATVLVKGDCLADITISDGGMVHIYGDLSSTLTINGLSEVVIGGSITQEGAIVGDGILRVFVGGDIEGQISNKSSSKLWGNGDLSGIIYTGNPSTRVHIIGDFLGRLMPVDSASLLYLDVRGDMSSRLIEKVAQYGWSEFNASVGSSDMAPGLYPKSQVSNSRWVIHSEIQ